MLDVRDLTTRWPKVEAPVLQSVSLSVAAGEFVAILGANGSGKTTFFKSIVRLIASTSGSIRVDGREMTDLNGAALQRARARVAMVTQHASLVRRRSVVANIAIGSLGRYRDLWTSLGALPRCELERALEYLQSVGLHDLATRRVATLSGGEAQRVSIARALAQQPRVILADEPVANLDPEAALDVMRSLRTCAHERGLAVLSTLHQPDLTLQHADRVVGLRRGRILFDVASREVSQAMLDSLYRPVST